MGRIAEQATARGYKSDVQLVLDLFGALGTAEAVAKDLGVTVSGLYKFLKRHGFIRKVVITWSLPTKSMA
jgi:hypothetical protein